METVTCVYTTPSVSNRPKLTGTLAELQAGANNPGRANNAHSKSLELTHRAKVFNGGALLPGQPLKFVISPGAEYIEVDLIYGLFGRDNNGESTFITAETSHMELDSDTVISRNALFSAAATGTVGGITADPANRRINLSTTGDIRTLIGAQFGNDDKRLLPSVRVHRTLQSEKLLNNAGTSFKERGGEVSFTLENFASNAEKSSSIFHITRLKAWYPRSELAAQGATKDLTAAARAKGYEPFFFYISAHSETIAGEITAKTLNSLSNPADAYLRFIRGFKRAGTLNAGCGLADSQIDLPSIAAWKAFCTSANLSCNGVILNEISQMEGLETIARAGRAVPAWRNGKVGVAFDAPPDYSPPVALYTPEQVIRDSLTTAWSRAQADGIEAAFFNAADNYKLQSIRRPLAGAPKSVRKVNLWGVTSKSQAERETDLLLKSQTARTKIITFKIGPEGGLLEKGDRIIVSGAFFSPVSGRGLASYVKPEPKN